MKNLKEFVQQNKEILLELLDYIDIGVYITDEHSNTLIVNKESERTGSMSRQNLMGHDMHELVNLGYVKESVSLKVLESGKREEVIQELGDGGQVYISGIPIYDGDKIQLVLCNERDISEQVELMRNLEEKEAMTAKYETELEYLRKQSIQLKGSIVSESLEMKNLIDNLIRVAKLDITVLLTGESGTGKETLANMIYENSLRYEMPFIKINCAAIPESLIESELFGYEKGAFTGADKDGKAGIFELANHGTLFLDEIGDLPLQAQSRFLRVLEERELMRVGGQEIIPIDVRIIAATNVDLCKAVKEGRFREDLYYRLNIIPMEIPPLRRRKEDIRELANHFISMYGRKYRIEKHISEEAVHTLEEYNWPGNIRELRNLIERLVVSFDGNEITKFQVVRQLYSYESGVKSSLSLEDEKYISSLNDQIEGYEKEILQEMIGRYKNISEVARLLKVDKSTISRKVKKYKIKI